MIEIVNTATIIIVTSPQCKITQQSRIHNCRQVKGFLSFYSKQKRDKQDYGISGKKRPELPGQDSATIDVI